MMSDHIKAIMGAGMLPALVAGSFYPHDDGLIWLMFAFGASWGGLWLQHE